MSELLLEILAEEIPAGVLPAAREELLRRVQDALGEARRTATSGSTKAARSFAK